MAGRGGRGGKGRGFSFDISAIGFGRGSEALPNATLQPPPLFPPLEKKPLPLRISEADDYMLVLKEEFKLLINTSPYYIKQDTKNKDIDRYSDRYKEKQTNDSTANWEPDWSYIPTELKIKTKRSKSHRHNPLKPNIKNSKRKRKLNTSAPDIDFEKLEEADKAETEGTDKPTQENKTTDGKAGEGSDDDADEEDDYDEEEQEEENDYLVSHFDDDDDLGDDDDKDEGPIY